jgi:hypothetical protein
MFIIFLLHSIDSTSAAINNKKHAKNKMTAFPFKIEYILLKSPLWLIDSKIFKESNPNEAKSIVDTISKMQCGKKLVKIGKIPSALNTSITALPVFNALTARRNVLPIPNVISPTHNIINKCCILCNNKSKKLIFIKFAFDASPCDI